MAKSIRSKIKRHYRNVKRAKMAPHHRQKIEEMHNRLMDAVKSHLKPVDGEATMMELEKAEAKPATRVSSKGATPLGELAGAERSADELAARKRRKRELAQRAKARGRARRRSKHKKK